MRISIVVDVDEQSFGDSMSRYDSPFKIRSKITETKREIVLALEKDGWKAISSIHDVWILERDNVRKEE